MSRGRRLVLTPAGLFPRTVDAAEAFGVPPREARARALRQEDGWAFVWPDGIPVPDPPRPKGAAIWTKASA